MPMCYDICKIIRRNYMKEEIITKVGCINIIDSNVVFGDGNPATKRGTKEKTLIGYVVKGIYNIYLVKDKSNKKEELTNIVIEKANQKMDNCVEKVHSTKLLIKSSAFAVANYRIHDEVAAALSIDTDRGYNSGKKCAYNIAAFTKCLYEKEDFFYENQYVIIKNIPSGTYKAFYMADPAANVVAIILQKKAIGDQPAIARPPAFPEFENAVAPIPRPAWGQVNWDINDDLPF